MDSTYRLVTGNSGLCEHLGDHPMAESHWRLECELSDDGKIPGDRAQLINPNGELLADLPISQTLPREINTRIRADVAKQGSAPPSPRVAKPAYRGTTGDERAAQILSTYQHDDWTLTVAHLSGAPADHVQILAPGGEIVGNAPTMPRNVIVGMATQMIKRHFAKSQLALVVAVEQVAAAAQPAKQPPPPAAESARAARQVGQTLQRPPEAPAPANQTEVKPAGRGEVRIPIASIGHFPGGNVREQFEDLDGLAASIRENGVVEPLIVNERDGRYTLIAGERRLRAAGLAGLTDVPCVVRSLTDEEALAQMLVENLHRRDLNPIEESRAYQRLLQVMGNRERVADRVGKSRVHVTEFLQLLDLPADMQHQVATGALAVKTGLEFLRKTKEAPEPVRQQIAQRLVDETPTSREAPKVIQQELEAAGVARATPPDPKLAAPPAATSQPETAQNQAKDAATLQSPAPVQETLSDPLFVAQSVLARFTRLKGDAGDSEFLSRLMDQWEEIRSN